MNADCPTLWLYHVVANKSEKKRSYIFADSNAIMV
jgi:hypothetical protein